MLAGTADKLDVHSRWEYDELPYWGGEVDACINAYTLASGAWFGVDSEKSEQEIVDRSRRSNCGEPPITLLALID